MKNIQLVRTMIFKNRQDAGQQLAQKLQIYKNEKSIILALPRGGVVVGYEVAKALNVPLNVLVVRKIGSPYNPEFAIGAIAEGNVQVINENSINLVSATKEEINEVINSEKKELQRRVNLYRGKPLPLFKNKTIIIVDDGLATGMTAQAAILATQKLKANKIILAVPVCAYETAEKLKRMVDDYICLLIPPELSAIGFYYQDFQQVTDEEVIKLLRSSHHFLS